MMTLQDTIQASLDQTLTRSGDCIDTGLQSGGELAVAPSLAGVRGVGFQRDTRFQLLPRQVLSPSDHRVQLVALLIAERDDVFFDGDHFPDHESAPLLDRGIESETDRGIKDAGYH